ncbi:MAG: hypothetical protein D6699_05640 [Aquificota bacterium]|nr:MAG: hypothetical protein D6699_05640 [Aquificota bacterium]
MVDVSYKQSGNVLLVGDVRKVFSLSYLALQDYSTFVWMSRVLEFVERWFIQYEPELFSLAVEYLQKHPENQDLAFLRFKLQFLHKLGLYKDSAFPVGVRAIAERLLKENTEVLNRIRLTKRQTEELNKGIEAQLSSLL